MAPLSFLLLILILSFFPSGFSDQAFTSVLVTQNGLDFVKDLLIHKAVSSMTPLQLPKIEKFVKIPVVGRVHMVLSNITIYQIDVTSSYVKLGDGGFAIIASGTTANLSMNWYYSYSTWLVPVQISDKGQASVEVEGMEVGLSLNLENKEGSLKLLLKQCGCYVKDISIQLDGGASWLYQGMVDAFDGKIGSAVENAITKKLKEGVSRLDLHLQALPKEIAVDDNASLNVTFVNDPLLSNSSIEIEVNGLFTRREAFIALDYQLQHGNPSVFCIDSSKMLGIAVHETVLNSASALYYNAKFMQWIVDKVPDQSILNTAEWKFIIPQLYKKYPNEDMRLNISLSSPPVIDVSDNKADAIVYADLIIDVLDAGEAVSVACISLVIQGSGSVKINGNNLTGNVKLDDFAMSLKWSKIGNLRMYLIQPVIWTLIQTVFVPYTNAHLSKGFPLPIIHGFTLQKAEITLSDSRIVVCSNVAYVKSGFSP